MISSTHHHPLAAGGVASGKVKGKAHPINYSFDVKIEGKPVVRNFDPFASNDYNTPPAPIIQSQPAPSTQASGEKDEEEEKCEYCGQKKHDFAEEWGTNLGTGGALNQQIFKGKNKQDHPWYSGPGSIAAHHLICTEALKNDDWAEFCRIFGYSINHRNNGVMLPSSMQLACQLHVPLHRSSHAVGRADGLPYPDRIRELVSDIIESADNGEFCDNPQSFVKKLDKLSKRILSKVSSFSYTLTNDGKDYNFGGCGCSGVMSITGKPKQACPQDRLHAIKQFKSKKEIQRNTKTLKIGE